ncbi:UNVERIFIED_CONTAM: hypothetical protein RMT77_016250 [Armadillidium vulgare]
MNQKILCFVTIFLILLLRANRCLTKGVWKSKCPELDIPNANIRIRARGRLAKIRCKSSFSMIEGDRRLSCIRKEWHGRIPHCIKHGCDDMSLENGMVIELYSGALIHFVCNPGYSLEGSPAVFCDGSNWNATAPVCEVPPPKPGHMSCAFETKDLCGWTQDHLDDFDWKWSTAIANTFQGSFGAKFDHTFNSIAGHYTYADSNEKWSPTHFARLFSPILEVPVETPSCISFYYHLYGPTSGTFNAYLKPEAVPFEQISPSMSVTGFHADEWLLAFLYLDDTFEDWFQVILEAQGGSGHVSDFAVDDFQVSSGDQCINLELQYEKQKRTTTRRVWVPTSVAMETSSTIEPTKIPTSSDYSTDMYTENEDETTLDTSSYINDITTSTKNSTSSVPDATETTSSPRSTIVMEATTTTTTGKKVMIPSTIIPTSVTFTIITFPKHSTTTTLRRKTLTPKYKTSFAPITKWTFPKTKSPTTSRKTTTTSATTSTTLSTTTAKKSTNTKSNTNIATTHSARDLTKFTLFTKYFTTQTSSVATEKPSKASSKANPKSLTKNKLSNGTVIALILGVAVSFILVAFAIILVWRKSRNARILEEDSDIRYLKEESKEEEQTNEEEKPSRRPFATSYRLLENNSYPQEYDGTAV